jgi:alkylation response protein AidB-like acyl-CoA dehydrogenase
MSATDRSMALGLRALRRAAGGDLLDRLGIRNGTERALYRSTRDGFRAAGAAQRIFAGTRTLGRPARPGTTKPPGLFDLTPTDEQRLVQDMCREFAEQVLRVAAPEADRAHGAGEQTLADAAGLGLSMLGVPEQLGGATATRCAVTSVLVAEALAWGDMGLALAILAPAGVATALSQWGDADQQATYLPALIDDQSPAPAALCLLEDGPCFDPLQPSTRLRRDGGGFVLSGTKTLVPRAAAAELLLIGARLDDRPVLVLVEPAARGVEVRPEPAMGLRGAALGRLRLQDVRLPATALLGDGDPEVSADCVRRARLAWCALSAGTARAVLDYVSAYANERVAFGEPISHRQSVAFAISDIAIEAEGMRLATLRAAARTDAGLDAGREIAVARSLCERHGMTIASHGVQLLGGHGYVCDHPLERWYRDLRATGVMEGALLA